MAYGIIPAPKGTEAILINFLVITWTKEIVSFDKTAVFSLLFDFVVAVACLFDTNLLKLFKYVSFIWFSLQIFKWTMMP